MLEVRGGWKFTGLSGVCTRLSEDNRHMVIKVSNDPDSYWPVGMEVLVDLDNETRVFFHNAARK